MAIVAQSQRDLQTRRNLERIAVALEGIHQTLGMFFYKMYEEDCAEQLTELRQTPNAEVRMKPE